MTININIRMLSTSKEDLKPTIDSIVHDTFTLGLPRSSPPATPARSVTPKVPSYVLRGQRPRPHVTLCLVRGLDGGSAEVGDEAAQLTLRLRATHDAVLAHSTHAHHLVHVSNAVILDEDLSAEGYSDASSPQSIVCHERMRTSDRQLGLSQQGHRLLFAPSFGLEDILHVLHSASIRKVVVEGSPLVESIIAARLYDKLLVSIAPRFSGLPCALGNIHYEVLGHDIVLSAEPQL